MQQLQQHAAFKTVMGWTLVSIGLMICSGHAFD
jgi:hypothetical protein